MEEIIKSTIIPFSGFYGSIHESQLDGALEMIFDHSDGNPIESLIEKAYYKVDWRKAMVEYAKAYSELFANEFGLKTLVFEDLDSPREYNFTTDRIFCKIALSEVKEIHEKVDREALKQKIKDTFTSYDGFISHYSNKLEDWPSDIADWDHNQIGTMLAVYIQQENGGKFTQYDEANLFDSSEWVYEIMENNIEDERLLKLASYIREREERQWRGRF